MNTLYFTLALMAFADGLIGIYVPIYFWNLGEPLWRILFFYLLHSVYFLFWLAVLIPPIKRMSDKKMMLLSLPFAMVYFLGLAAIDKAPFLFYLLPAAASLNGLLFNVGYHINFTDAADRDSVGKEVGARYMVGSLTQLFSPFLGGLLIASFGFRAGFVIGIIILIFAVLPLFFFPYHGNSSELSVSSVIDSLKDRRLLPFTISGFGYASEIMVSRIIWPLFIFLSIGSLQNFGGIISLGLVASSVATFSVGFLSDAGKRRIVLSLTSVLFSLVWVFRMFSLGPIAVVASHAVGNAVNASLMVAWTSQYYKITRAVSQRSSFILSREALYHLSRIVFMPFLAVLAYFIRPESFFKASFLISAALSLIFLFANKFRLDDLFGNKKNVP